MDDETDLSAQQSFQQSSACIYKTSGMFLPSDKAEKTAGPSIYGSI